MNIWIIDCCCSWTSQFFQVHGRDWTLGYFNISLYCLSKFFPVLETVGKLGVFKVFFISYFMRLWGLFIRKGIYMGREDVVDIIMWQFCGSLSFEALFQSLNNGKRFLGSYCCQDSPRLTCLLEPRFAEILPNMK